MNQDKFKTLRFFLAVCLFLIDILILLAASYVYKEVNLDLAYFEYINLSYREVFFVYLIALWIFFSFIFSLYRSTKIVNLRNNIISTSLAVLLTTFIFLLTPKITPVFPTNRMPVFLFVGISFLGINFMHIIFYWLYQPIKENTKLLVLGSSLAIDSILEAINIKSERDGFYKSNILAFYNTDKDVDKASLSYKTINNPEKLYTYVKRMTISKVVYEEKSLEKLEKIVYEEIVKTKLDNIELVTVSDYYEDLTKKVLINKVGEKYILGKLFNSASKKSIYYTMNRIINLLISGFGLVFTVLLVPFILFFNLFLNKGPLFYSQERIGRNKDVFKIHKFRSMVTDAEKDGAQWATKNDARITKFGKFLRKTRIDELPQFWNILKGDMNLLGPRPERQVFIDELSKTIPFFSLRNTIKPGVTGWAQIMYKYGNTTEDSVEKLAYDLFYIKHRSLFFDLRIIVKTILVMIKFKGN